MEAEEAGETLRAAAGNRAVAVERCQHAQANQRRAGQLRSRAAELCVLSQHVRQQRRIDRMSLQRDASRLTRRSC